MTRPRPPASPAAPAPEPAAGPVPRPRPSPRPRSGSHPSPVPGEPAAGPVDAEVVEPARSGVPAAETGPTETPAADAAAADRPATAVPDAGQAEVWELVHRAQTGDAEGFGLLYDRYVDVVFRYLHHRVGDRATAEDFTSETFVRALRRIDSLSFQGRDVGAWLVTIARNIVLDHVKSSRYRLEVTTADMRDADRATDGPEGPCCSG